MALSIKDPEVDRLARELAEKTGLSITKAIRKAIGEQLKREGAKGKVSLKDEIMEISRRAAKLPRASNQSPEEIIGYDANGLPK